MMIDTTNGDLIFQNGVAWDSTVLLSFNTDQQLNTTVSTTTAAAVTTTTTATTTATTTTATTTTTTSKDLSFHNYISLLCFVENAVEQTADGMFTSQAINVTLIEGTNVGTCTLY
jgi:hypothetical protein